MAGRLRLRPPRANCDAVKPKRLLILGGTTEATALIARASLIPGLEIIVSLALRTQQPVIRAPNTRLGGFGGIAGLTNYLRQEHIDLLIDATHPFAEQISHHAATSAQQVGIPLMLLVRPPWEKQAGERWLEVASHEAAAQILPGLSQRIFLTIGRQELAAYAHLKNIWFLMRMIDPPAPESLVPPGQILLERGPFDLAAERSLLIQYQIGAIVSKNSGGEATYAKIIAARELGIPVVMIQRPPLPQSEKVTTVDDAISWLRQHQ